MYYYMYYGASHKGSPESTLISLLNMQLNLNSRTDARTLLEQTLAGRANGGESTEPKVVGVHSTNSQLRPTNVCSYSIAYYSLHTIYCRGTTTLPLQWARLTWRGGKILTVRTMTRV